MADSNAMRTRRHRRHRAGDHAMCDPERCEFAPERLASVVSLGVTPVTPPSDLGKPGRQLWDETTDIYDVPALAVPLLVEACRITDRLAMLDRQLCGEDWLRFRHRESGTEVVVYVDRVLAEAREQATALKGIVTELNRNLRRRRTQPEKPSLLADIQRRRAEKMAAAGRQPGDPA